MHKALTMRDVMKMKPAEMKRRGKRIGTRPQAKQALEKYKPHPTLKRWRYAEPSLEIIGQ